MLRTAKFKNEPVYFTDEGRGRVVVLVHGFLGSHEIWRNTRENLKKSYRVIAVDLPGHGQTPCFGYAHSMELMAKCVKAILDSLKLKRYVLIGHSMGGYVALAFADLFPDNVKGICLFHSSAYADTDDRKKERLRAIEIVKANKTLYTSNTIRNLFAQKNLRYLKEEIRFAATIAKRTSQRGIVGALYGMMDRKSRDLILGLVQYPIMMVSGEYDNMLPVQQLHEQSKIIKNGVFLHLEHDGHFGFLESPRKSHQWLRKFLRKCFY
jgi:pimeloyl-ACP methyl ester carboxylesterase